MQNDAIYIYISYTLSWKITRGITLAKQGKINKREKESSKEEIQHRRIIKGSPTMTSLYQDQITRTD